MLLVMKFTMSPPPPTLPIRFWLSDSCHWYADQQEQQQASVSGLEWQKSEGCQCREKVSFVFSLTLLVPYTLLKLLQWTLAYPTTTEPNMEDK